MVAVSSDDRGAVLNVAMWIVLFPMVSMTAVKVYIKWDVVRKLDFDDGSMIFAMLAAAAQCVASSAQVGYGLGKDEDRLTSQQLEIFYRAQYIGQLMYLLTIFSAKLTGLYFFLCLTSRGLRRRVVKASMTFIGVWIVMSLLVTAFQCHFPKPWLSGPGECINQRAFWTVNVVIDCVSQILVGMLPIYLLWGLRMAKSKKLLTMLSFTPNMLTLPLSVLRVVYLYVTFNSTNYAKDCFNLALVTNLHASISVIAAGIPFSKTVIDSLVLAPIIITDETRRVATSYNVDTYLSSKKSHKTTKIFVDNPVRWPAGNRTRTVTTITIDEDREKGEELQDYASYGSQDKMVIQETRTATVIRSLADDQQFQ